ncbi:Uncharacterised protein [Rothia dentocariosa]|uniref:Uncharacterized protein n=1 Tax=Rothia dentocariosa TaxID=2047 RepID=A0A3S5BUZ1_9MICC|nr:Uncharacterised protein [Rothia dentocariosa]
MSLLAEGLLSRIAETKCAPDLVSLECTQVQENSWLSQNSKVYRFCGQRYTFVSMSMMLRLKHGEH